MPLTFTGLWTLKQQWYYHDDTVIRQGREICPASPVDGTDFVLYQAMVQKQLLANLAVVPSIGM